MRTLKMKTLFFCLPINYHFYFKLITFRMCIKPIWTRLNSIALTFNRQSPNRFNDFGKSINLYVIKIQSLFQFVQFHEFIYFKAHWLKITCWSKIYTNKYPHIDYESNIFHFSYFHKTLRFCLLKAVFNDEF